MNIFFDARWTNFKTHFGVSRYGAELAAALAKIHPITLIIYDEHQLKLLPGGVPYVKLNSPMSIKELLIARKLNKLGADIVFTPLQIMGGWGRRYRLIVTVHDVFYYQFPSAPGNLPRIVRGVWWLFYQAVWPQRLLLSFADCVATVSYTAKRQIAAMRLTSRAIKVVSNAPHRQVSVRRDKTIKKQLVYIGSFMKYKNVETLLRVMPLLPDYTLHLASPISAKRRAELEPLIANPAQIKFWNGVTDQQAQQLLAQATALVTASKAEGFGLPVIEAMSQGTPAICSDMPIFHEVGGAAAQYCNPDDPASFAAAVRRLQNPKIASGYSKKGLAQAKKFSWDRSAKQLLGVMQKLIAQK